PYGSAMILHGEWDTIYHEHLSYFLAGPFCALVNGLTASIVRAEFVTIHGGSLRLAIRRDAGSHCSEILDLVARESQAGLHGLETYRKFAGQVDRVCQELHATVASVAGTGKKAIGFGASAKGNTLLNRCPLPLAYIVDDNPLKHGYLTPGKNIPIYPP